MQAERSIRVFEVRGQLCIYQAVASAPGTVELQTPARKCPEHSVPYQPLRLSTTGALAFVVAVWPSGPWSDTIAERGDTAVDVCLALSMAEPHIFIRPEWRRCIVDALAVHADPVRERLPHRSKRNRR